MEAKKIKLLIAIPSYKCEKQLPRLLIELDKIINELKTCDLLSIAVIENAGPDQTCEKALATILNLKYSHLFKVFRNQKNYHLGGTHKIAFDMANKVEATHLLIIHGDHQALPSDIPRLIEKSILNQNATVLGSRFENMKQLKNYSLIRQLGNRFLNTVYSLLTKSRITDLGSGLNLFYLKDFSIEAINSMSNDFTFNMDLLLYFAEKENKIIIYEAIFWQTTDQKSNANAILVGLKAMQKVILWKFGQKHKKRAFNYTTLQV